MIPTVQGMHLELRKLGSEVRSEVWAMVEMKTYKTEE